VIQFNSVAGAGAFGLHHLNPALWGDTKQDAPAP
jgi:hypothetical protein